MTLREASDATANGREPAWRGTWTDLDVDLGRDDVATCVSCKAQRDWVDMDAMKEYAGLSPEDPVTCHCGSQGFIIGERRAPAQEVAKRWGGLSSGWTALPNAMLENAATLGLEMTGVCVLLELESYRRGQEDAVYPSAATLAGRLGCNEQTIRTHLARMEEAGLIERHHRPTTRGRFTTPAWTRHGLTEAVALIESNRAEGLPDDAALPHLLERLRTEAASPPGKSPAGPPGNPPLDRRGNPPMKKR